MINPAKATTINVAGRQRMLSQKMMKEACFVTVGLQAKDSLAALQNTMALFDASLADLISGNEETGIIPPPNDEVAGQLERVRVLWEAYATNLSQIQLDGPDNAAIAATLAPQSDELLATMHKAVQLYVAASTS